MKQVSEFTVVAEVYSLNQRRKDVDLPTLEQDGFEYTVTLLKNGCGCVIAEFDSQEGLQPCQVCHDKKVAEQWAIDTAKEAQADIDKGIFNAWFNRINFCSCK